MEFSVVIDNNNNNNNNNNDNSIIFFKIWRNKFIKQQIFIHLKLYSYNLYPRIFNNVESIINFKQKEYLNSIHLISFYLDDDDDDDEFCFSYIDSNNNNNNNHNNNNNNIFEQFDSNIKPKTLNRNERNKIKRINKKLITTNKINKNTTTTTTTTSESESEDEGNNIVRRGRRRKYPSSQYDDSESESYTLSTNSSSYKSSEHSEHSSDDEEIVKQLTSLNNKFSKTDILKSILPSNVKNIFIDFKDKPIDRVLGQFKMQEIPESITKLKIGDTLLFSIKDYFSSGSGGSYYSNLRILELGNSFNEEIPVNTLPINLNQLSIGNGFKKEILVGSLPSKLEHLHIGTSFNLEFQENQLPLSLVSLTCLGYNQDLKSNIIPPHLKFISLRKFNIDLNRGVLPNSLETLLLGEQYTSNIVIGAIPFNLKKLVILGNWNQKIDPFLLPNSLTHLELPKYNKPPQNLPNNLKYLNIGTNESLGQDKSSGGGLLGSIKKKFTSNSKNTNIGTTNAFIPNNLETLVMNKFTAYPINQGNLPLSLTSLTVSLYYDHTLKANSLPPNIKKLKFHSFDNGGQPLKKECLPLKLEELEFTLNFNQKIESLPNECFRVLKLGNAFNQPIKKGVLPDTIRLVELSCSTFDKEIHLPNQSLTTLKYSIYDRASPKSYPSNCNSIIDSNNHHNEIQYSYPLASTSLFFTGNFSNVYDPFSNGCLLKLNNLSNLELPSTFNRELLASQLPNSIKTLTIGRSYYKEISADAFPSLEILTIKGNGCPIIKDPTLFKNLKTINVNYSNTNFLDSIDQLKFENFISLYKE